MKQLKLKTKANLVSSLFSKCYNTTQAPLSDVEAHNKTLMEPTALKTWTQCYCVQKKSQTIDTTKANAPDQISGTQCT